MKSGPEKGRFGLAPGRQGGEADGRVGAGSVLLPAGAAQPALASMRLAAVW